MSDGMYVALSGAMARQQQLDVVSHNMANVATTGYREQRATFADVMDQAQSPIRQVEMTRLAVDTREGTIEATGNPLDLALTGSGWFRVQTEAGPALTRDGAFRLDNEGTLVNRDGLAVLSRDGAPITIGSDDGQVTIDEDGTLRTDVGMQEAIGVVDVQDAELLTAIGGGYVTTDENNLMPATEAKVSQGFLESSNASPMRGMTEMITLQRYFDTMQKLLQEHRNLDGRAISTVGGNR
jgi:flagellar basal-body rod protein FlgF